MLGDERLCVYIFQDMNSSQSVRKMEILNFFPNFHEIFICFMRAIEESTVKNITYLPFFGFSAFGFPGGAPSKTCLDGVPHHHGINRQISTPPYIMEASDKKYRPNDIITGTSSI